MLREPLAQLVEETPHEKCIDLIADQLQNGLTDRQFPEAIFLAAMRGSGMLAHSVFVIHPVAELRSRAAAAERLLPVFWSLNNFKYWQEWHRKSLDRFKMPQRSLPSPEEAAACFRDAVEEADPEGAQRAVMALLRKDGLPAVMELLWPYAARDCVGVGHNAIAVVNGWRALPAVGMEHAEEMLCWLVPRLVGTGDQWFMANQERARSAASPLPTDWSRSQGKKGVTIELLRWMRELDTDAACDLALSALSSGSAGAGAIWDAVHLHAGELMMLNASDGHPVHSNTAANALHFAFRKSQSSSDRLFILLQAIAWQCQHRRRMIDGNAAFAHHGVRIDELMGSSDPVDQENAPAAILAALSTEPDIAAQLSFDLAQQHPGDRRFEADALRLLPERATPNAHDIKFPLAIFEDSAQVSPEWRPHLLAASVYWLQGSDKPVTPFIQQAKEVIASIPAP